MALQLLGDNSVSVGGGWTAYNPIALQSNRIYLLELETISANPNFILSSFQVRFSYPTQNTPDSFSLLVTRFFYEPLLQHIEFPLSPLLANTGNVNFYVRRFPFFSNPGTLAACNVRLSVDPAVFEKIK